VTAGDGRRVRRATVRLGVLAAVLLLAGLLPWVTAGPLPARLVALPLLLAGALVAVLTARVGTMVPQLRPSAPPVERRCDGCVCGTAGGCAARSGDSGAPAAG
jgi:hypothetical protein